MKVAFDAAGERGITLLRHEGNMHSALAGLPSVPQLRGCGSWEKGYYLAFPLLGQSLEAAVQEESKSAGGANRRTTVALAVATAILRALSEVHARGLLHRDVTPANIMFGKGGSGIWLCDFGLARPYRDGKGHVPETHGHELVGTLAFASAAVRGGTRPARRDDIEALAYCVWYVVAGGRTPWVHDGTDEDLPSLARLVEKTGHPIVMRILSHARSLSFIGRPDYDGLLLDVKRARISGRCIPPGARAPNE